MFKRVITLIRWYFNIFQWLCASFALFRALSYYLILHLYLELTINLKDQRKTQRHARATDMFSEIKQRACISIQATCSFSYIVDLKPVKKLFMK